MQPRLSVIIPAFNEVQRIEPTLRSVEQYLKLQKFTSEVIVVDDGSNDGTSALVRHLASCGSRARIIQLPENEGKGAAVKIGMLSAVGELRLYMDADGSTAIGELEKLLPYVNGDYDICIGSRLIEGAQKKTKQNRAREFLGWVFRTLVQSLFKINVRDPQNGFKLFSSSAVEKIFRELITKGWCFDVEVFILAKKNGLKVKEIPITWVNDERSKIRFLGMIKMLIDLMYIRRRYSVHIA